MSRTGLSKTQRSVLRLLAGMQPPWVLFGGGALLIGVVASRTTRDLDLRWAGRDRLGSLPEEVKGRLHGAGMAVTTLQTTPSFVRLRVQGGEELVLDLVAQPAAEVGSLHIVELDGVAVPVPSVVDQLAEKLRALLGRAELRDLHDVSVLVEHGGDLEAAATRALRIDGGFSPMTLAWVLRRFPVQKVAAAEGVGQAEIEGLVETRDGLVRELLALSAPVASP